MTALQSSTAPSGTWQSVAAAIATTPSDGSATETGTWVLETSGEGAGGGYNSASTVLPSLISVVLSTLSTLAEAAAATLQLQIDSVSGGFVQLGENATTEATLTTQGLFLSDSFNITPDLTTPLFNGSTGHVSGVTSWGFYNYTGSTFSSPIANFTPTMEFINESSIFTQDGMGGAGAQYRVGPVETGTNETVFSNISQNQNRGMNPYQSTCILYDFIIEALFMGCFCIFGFTGNTLSMICLWRDKSKTATPFLLVSLELADTLFLVTVFLLRVLTSIHMFTGWFQSLDSIFPYMGSYVFAFALITETGSIYLTVLVTVNRYISVCRPYEASDLCSIYHARRHVVIVTAFSIIFNLPRFFEYRVIHVVTHDNRTVPRAELTPFANNIIYQIVYANALYFLVLFLIPLVTLIILNYKLIKALRKTKKKRAQLISSSVDSQSRSEDDITLVLIVVVIVFIISQTPALITQSLFSFLHMSKRICPNAFFYYERISDLMVVANASMNFIIYCFCSTKFRQILVNLLCKKSLESPEQSYEKHTRITKVRTTKGGRGAKDSMV